VVVVWYDVSCTCMYPSTVPLVNVTNRHLRNACYKRKRDALLPPTTNFSGWEPITTSAVNHHAYPPLTTPDRGNWQPGFRFRSVGPSAPTPHRYAMPATKREPRTVCSGGLIRYVCAVFSFFSVGWERFYHCTASHRSLILFFFY
jgi:hypothetical protein